MKKAVYLFMLSLLGTFFLSFTSLVPKLSIKKNQLMLGGKNMAETWSLQDAVAALGNAERTRDGYNITHTYDKLGMVLFEKKTDGVGSGQINEIQVYFSPPAEPNEVTPNGYYKDFVAIDKLKAGSDVSYSYMKKTLKKWEQRDSYMEHSYRMNNDTLYVYFQFNDTDDKLLKISIGPHKK